MNPLAKGEEHLCISGTKRAVTPTRARFVQRCAVVTRGNRNAPKRFQRHKSLKLKKRHRIKAAPLYFGFYLGLFFTKGEIQLCISETK